MLSFSSDGSLQFVRGDDLRIPLTFKSGGVATDLTGYSFAAQIRSKPNGYIMVAFDVDLSNAATGQVVLTAPHTTTQAIRLETAWWDLQQTNPSGKIDTIIGPAEVDIQKDVTIV